MENRGILIFVLVAFGVVLLLNNVFDRSSLTGRYADQGQRGLSTCTDTDDFDIYTSGVVTVNLDGELTDYNDRCSGGEGLRVMENYCDGNRRAFMFEWCANGEVCSDGRCVPDRTSNYY